MSHSDEKLLAMEQAIRQALIERSVAQGKFEIAADVMHDIGNAVVGIGSYLTRIRRVLEQHSSENLKNLAGFFTTQQAALAGALGEAKAGAVLDMLNGMVEAQRVHKEEILQSIGEQTRIISHIQEIIHIQREYAKGQDATERKPVSLRSVIDDCLAMQLASMEKRGIVISREIPEEVPSVMGDRTRLMQVILNILKNSIEAIDVTSADKSIYVRVTVVEGSLTLQVRDTGCGFDEETGRRLFGRGYTTKSSGTGLGLHNCRAIVEDHAGTIELVSEGPGKGSVTIITFKI